MYLLDTNTVSELRGCPAQTLLLVAASPNDTAERFMARDAFWAAVLGDA